MNFHGKINEDYAWEIEIFDKYRKIKDGITFFDVNAQLDWYAADHNPQFTLVFILLNFKIWDISIYNIWHEYHPNSPYFIKKMIEARFHSRKKFYHGKDIYWYEFIEYDFNIDSDSYSTLGVQYHGLKIPGGFLRVPDTKYYEYASDHEHAIEDLTKSGFDVIVKGDEI